MYAVEDTGGKPVLQADQGTDGQEGFDTRRTLDRRHDTILQLMNKNGELNTDKQDHPQEKVLHNLAERLDVQPLEELSDWFMHIARQFS